jgi:proteic killer suppression protein
MIRSFGCKETKKIWDRQFSKMFPQEIQAKARRRLLMIDASAKPEDLKIPPNNQLKKYCGKKKLDKLSIRINSQWRICFYFENGNALEVEIVDYH